MNNFYVNCLHVNHDEEIADDSLIYQTFKSGKKISVAIMALIIVPYKTVIGICFPDQATQKIDDKCPNLTIAVNEFFANQSKQVLEKSCLTNNSCFGENYKILKQGYKVKAGKEILKGSI